MTIGDNIGQDRGAAELRRPGIGGGPPYFQIVGPITGNEEPCMCRNIKTLANFEPPATDDEIRASALQFVRKLSGATRPSRANEAAFNQAVDEVAAAANKLVNSLHTNAPPRNREVEMRKAKERSLKRFA